MKFLLSFFSLLMIPSFVCAQEPVQLSNNQLNVNIGPLSVSYEKKVDVKRSFTLSGGIGYGFYISSGSSGGTETVFITAPFGNASFRNYYQRKRVKKDNLQNNSGNYVGIFSSYTFEALGDPSSINELEAYLETSNVFLVGPVWGFQRNYASGIHLGFSIGPGYASGKYIESGFTFVGGFEFGFILSSK